MDMLLLALMALAVGFISGCTSVGGVLLIPAAMAWSGLEPRTVAGTMLLAFFFAGLTGTFLHWKAGRIDFGATIPLCLGAVIFGYAGAIAKQYVPIPVLSGILGASIALAGFFSLTPVSDRGIMSALSERAQNIGLFMVGAGVAFLSGLTGAGGPILSVPTMLFLGYPPLMTIAVARPLQIIVTLSGSLGNFTVGTVDYKMALFITVLLISGVTAGTYCVRFFNPRWLKIAASLLCVFTGLSMLAKVLFD